MIRWIVDKLMDKGLSVTLILVLCLSISAMQLQDVPVTLLPQSEEPVIGVRFNYTGLGFAEARDMVEEILPSMKQIDGLRRLEYDISEKRCLLRLRFEPGSNMHNHHIQTGEQLDRIYHSLPEKVDRPLLIPGDQNTLALLKIICLPDTLNLRYSNFIKAVVLPRIEQIQGITLADISGDITGELEIDLDPDLMHGFGLSRTDLLNTINKTKPVPIRLDVNNGRQSQILEVKSEELKREQLLNHLITPQKAKPVRIHDIVKSVQIRRVSQGQHRYNGKDAIVIKIYSEPGFDVPHLSQQLKDLLDELQTQIPEANYIIREDQTFLLQNSIRGLIFSIGAGILVAAATVLIFLGSMRLSVIIAVSLPLCLLLCSGLFAITGTSINIISLSGIAFGIGLMIDNAIVIIENIHRRKQMGISLRESCTSGAAEVFIPLAGSVLSTLVVYLPLVLIQGKIRLLLKEQALGLAILLFSSLLLSVTVLPLLYKYMGEAVKKRPGNFYLNCERIYRSAYWFCIRRPAVILGVVCCIFVSGLITAVIQPFAGIPETTPELGVITLAKHDRRSREQTLKKLTSWEEIEGNPGYMLQEEESNAIKVISNYADLQNILDPDPGNTRWKLEGVPTTFTQLFAEELPPVQLRIRGKEFGPSKSFIQPSEADTVFKLKQSFHKAFGPFDGHDLTSNDFFLPGSKIFTSEGNLPVRFHLVHRSPERRIAGSDGHTYPASELYYRKMEPKGGHLVGDEHGSYIPFNFTNTEKASDFLDSLLRFRGDTIESVNVVGSLMENRHLWTELIVAGCASLLLLYIVLVIQFNSFSLPLLILMHLPLSIAGSFILTWVAGGSINMMTGIGMIIMSGIVVNDAILKVSTIRMLAQSGLKIHEAVANAGLIRLKAILMTTATTITGCLPIFIFDSLGTQLQRSLALSLVGGILFATASILFVLPAAYHFFMPERHRII